MKKISLSANIETGFPEGTQYVVTPNTRKVLEEIVNGYQSGIHSYTIIGTYGTGKSSFLIALKEDLEKRNKQKYLLGNPQVLGSKDFEVLTVIGDYSDLSLLLARKLNIEGNAESVIDALRSYYNRLNSKGIFLVIVIDEFGKVLEHAAKNNPERELYFLQKLAEFVNVPTRKMLLLTTLHQNFSAYAKDLTQAQRNEWTKVKGRFKEIVFVEPVEQILLLAASQYQERSLNITDNEKENLERLFQLALDTKFVSEDFTFQTALSLYPLDPFSAYSITQAIQRYGQNERSLFSFLHAQGKNSFQNFHPYERLTYNLQMVYDYIVYNFYSFLKDANTDSMNWSAMKIAIERVEGQQWDSKEDMLDAVRIVKAIDMLNLLGSAGFSMSEEQFVAYANLALNIENAQKLIEKLKSYKIIRYAEYKHRLILFEGTDINIEEEISKAGLVVSRPVSYIAELAEFFSKKVAPVKAYYYHCGTPRYFKYEILDEVMDIIPTGDVDGFVELIFPSEMSYIEEVKKMSKDCEHAIIFAFFNNTDKIVDHLYQIDKYEYILRHVLIDKADHVAVNEINNLRDYEEVQLNRTIQDSLFAYNGNVTWIFKGQEAQVNSQRDFNKLLSQVCDKIYSQTPIMVNELFNKNKLSSSISSAKAKYIQAMVNNSDVVDLGFEANKFPPEKTIYYSLLKNTGLHKEGHFTERPSNPEIMSLWNACEEFLQSTTAKPRKISELVKKLSSQPYKLKAGFLDFWIPTYLFIKRQEYSLYGANGAYIPEINIEFFELLQKHPSEYLIKAFDVSGVRMEFFNQYRKFVNLKAVGGIKSDQLVDTIKPFFFFYNRRLNDYAKHTQKFDHIETLRFRDILAKAKDPEKTFLEDLPEALGYEEESKNKEEFAKQYAYIINRAVRELRGCYSKLIDRIEQRLVEVLGLSSYDYDKYIVEIRERLSPVKTYLLTDRLKEFYNHAMSEFDNRIEWYQSVCYTALDKPLERLRDEQEEKLIEELIELFNECEKYADISKVDDNKEDDVFSFDMVCKDGTIVKPQTYRLMEKDRQESETLERKINSILQDHGDIAVPTLLRILKERTNQ
ncbi:MAG: hypothetical protein ACOYJF_02090 [Prevotella sp.]|jgi:hypothetical protein